MHHWRRDKILTLAEAAEQARVLRDRGIRLVTVNGAFDVLHAGHLDFLEEAREQGDILFVGLNSDASIREGKGSSRPYIGEQERAALLAALICVDYVVVIDAPYIEVQNVLLRAVRPVVHVNGSDYGEPSQWVEWPVMHEVGAVGYVVDRREGLSTSELIEKIKQS